MKHSVKKLSKKSLSILIALIMVFSALPFTPSISADAAVVKNEISVWDASNVTVNGYRRRFSAVDSSAETSFSGIHFDTVTRPTNANYITLSNAAASFAVFESSTASNENGAVTSTGFDKGISGDHWSVTATFAYLTSNSTTIFGIGTSAERNYTVSNDYKSKGNVADLVDIRANGSVYVGTGTGDSNTLESKGTVLTSSELISSSATDTKTITVEYNSGVLTISLNGTVKATYDVDADLFYSGVGNFFMGRNCQVFGGGTAPYYKISGGNYLGTMNFYSLSGATYEGESASESSLITNPGNLTLHWLASEDYTKDASKNTYDINSTSDVTWETTGNVPSLIFKGNNGNSSVKRSFEPNISSTGISSSIESGGAGVTIAFMAYTNNQYDVPFFTIYGDKTEFSYAPSGRILYRNSSYSSSNSATQNIQNTSAISTGTWHKIIIVLKSAKSMDVYVDNSTAIKSISNNAFYDNNTWATTHTIKLGASKDDTEKFNGAIRDFRIYNKSLTTSADITSLMSDMERNKANTKSYNVSAVSAYGLLGKSQPGAVRLQNGDMTIANDGYAGNTTIGILRIPLSDFQTGDMAGSESKLLLNVSSTWFAEGTNSSSSNTYYSRYVNDLYTDVYYTTNDVSSYVSSSGTRSALGTIALNTDYATSLATVKSNVALLGASDATKIGSIPHTTIGQYSLDVANAINATLNANKKDLYIILVKNAVDGYGTDQNGPWTDTHFLINQQGISYTKVQEYSFVNAAGVELRKVQASSATEAAKYIPTEVTPTRYEQDGYGLGTHNVFTYSWPTSPTNNVFTEKATKSTGFCENEFINKTATTHDAVCKLCRYTQTIAHTFETTSTVQPGDVNNGYTVKTCSNCEYAKNDYLPTDWSGYDAQKKVIDDLLADRSKFSTASVNECQTAYNNAVNGVRSGDETKSQKYIDNKIKALIAAKDLLKSTVTFEVYDDSVGGSPKLLTTESFDVKYLDSKQLDVPNDYITEYAVTSWKRNINSVDRQIATNTSSILAVVSTNITYMVYLKKTTIDENQAISNAVITLNNKSNKVVDVGYATKTNSANVTISGNEITVGGVTLTAPNYSFYTISGFTINGKTVANGDTIAIDSNMVIRPVYTPSHTVTITRATGSEFLINGEDVGSKQVDWNKKIVLTTKNGSPVTWKAGVDYNGNNTIEDSEKSIVAYGSTYSFYSNSNVTIYAEATVEPTEPTASIGLFTYNADENKVTVVNNFFVPSGMKAVKAGVVLSTKTDDRDKLIAQTTGRFEGTEKDFSGTDLNKNQIRISVTRTATTSFTMYALAYVVVGNQTYYAPTVQSISYTA